MNRIPFFIDAIKNKKVLHIGCADFPIFDIQHNLHYILSKTNTDIDGYDPNIETISKMKQLKEFEHLNLFTVLPNKKYDVILVPEVIEHVDSVKDFLLDLSHLCHENTIYIITGPNAFCDEHIKRNINYLDSFIEIVHPDHYCWYSPYTLPATIKKIYSKMFEVDIKEIGTLNNDTSVYVIFSLAQL